MGFITEALWQIKQGEYKSAAKVLTENLDNGLNPTSRISLMEWIAECYLKCEELLLAANWFEKAGVSILECPEIPNLERRRKAIRALEKALDCHKDANNTTEIKRITLLKYSLAPSIQ
ncbi:MAG: hypothetical protein M1368_06630 [Thaumarchaeota archaeon]|nr:hypothetical protein [Nitrososphaerota archaeon]